MAIITIIVFLAVGVVIGAIGATIVSSLFYRNLNHTAKRNIDELTKINREQAESRDDLALKYKAVCKKNAELEKQFTNWEGDREQLENELASANAARLALEKEINKRKKEENPISDSPPFSQEELSGVSMRF